jgi:Tat protein translocase TatB subunit
MIAMKGRGLAMFGTLGGPELFLIFVVALIVFGPRKLPEIGKSLGKMMAEFRRASNDFRSTIESEVESEKIRESMRIEPPKAAPSSPVAPKAADTAVPREGEATTPEGGEGATSAGEPASPPTADAAAETPPGAPGEGPSSPEAAAEEPSGGAGVPDTVSRQPTAPAERT